MLDALRIVSWNLGQLYLPKPLRALFGEGLFEPWLVPKVGGGLRALNPHVAVLQEMQSPTLLEDLRQQLGHGYAAGIINTGSSRQVAVLHRLGPGWRVTSVDLGFRDAYTHALALEGVLDNGLSLRVVGVHATSQSPGRRARYFDHLIDWIDSQPFVDLEILTGDFNIPDRACGFVDASTMRALRARMVDTDPQSQPTFLGITRLDYLFCRARRQALTRPSLAVVKRLRHGLQDHDPICADFPLGLRTEHGPR